jgi:cellulase/cellobiase CelA1
VRRKLASLLVAVLALATTLVAAAPAAAAAPVRVMPAVTGVLGAVTPTTPPVTTPPVTTPPPSGGACTATYRVVSQWTGGFQGEVTVRNGGAAATSAWTATFSFGGGQQVAQAWNATVTQTGAAVTARHVSWNGLLMPGGTATFGFLANSTGTNPVPAVACTLA